MSDTATRVTYGRLSPLARSELSDRGASIAAYVRYWFPDGEWRGDRCGCPDDRCRDGYHHEVTEDCGCLDALLLNPPAGANWWVS